MPVQQARGHGHEVITPRTVGRFYGRPSMAALGAACLLTALASGCTSSAGEDAARGDSGGGGTGATPTGGSPSASGGTTSTASGASAAVNPQGGAPASGGTGDGGGLGGTRGGAGTGGAAIGGVSNGAGTSGGHAGAGAAGGTTGTGGSSTSGAGGDGGGPGGTRGGAGTGGVQTGGVSNDTGTGGGFAGRGTTGGRSGGGGETTEGGASGSGGAAGRGGTTSTGGVAGSATGGGPVVGDPRNPILPGLNADPQIALFDGVFYIYPTTDGFDGWSSSVFHVFSSPDLVSWTDEGVILDLPRDLSWADSRAWAPGIARKNGTFYYYFSADTQIGVATSSSPTGPFKDALGKPLVTAGQYGGQSIDPYAFTDDDGRSYLYFGNGSVGHVVELNDDMISFQGTPRDIAVSGFREGSVAFKRNGIYYFMWSEGDTRSEDYDVAYGTSTSPLGPFTKAAVNPILKKNTSQGILATGHNSVLALPNGDYYIAYHRFAIPNGDGMHREVCLDRLYFNEDGTIVPVVPTR
ncbi:MAG: family 43 glycosylhydrolase [Polyangiaceae bacterium]|nr:family 43 glycosylhydrolase [Polyangiaceae bacterium]